VARKVAIVHAWDWTPKAVAVLKERHPEALVVRDVVVNRYHEFYSGTPITEQEKVTDAFFSPSTFTTSKLVEWGIPEDKIYEIPFGVDTDAFRPSKHEQPELSPQGGTPSAPVRFAFSGAVSRRKGADTLLRAWKQLRLENAELHLYGKVRDVQRELEDTKGVIAHGHVPLVEELPKNSVYVFPSTLEGSAKSVYEALACGLPVITTPDSGSIVRDGIDGFIVPPGDDQALNQAMRRLYDDPELRRELGQNARKRAEDHTWEAYGRRVWQVYRALLKNSNR
jgi:glycosyltransferase involved in cell wall biosynthesis